MTTQIPTSNPEGGRAQLSGAQDESGLLNRLAAEFFALAPDLAAQAPRWADVALGSQMALPASAVPADYVAALPVASLGKPAPGVNTAPTPYYFLEQNVPARHNSSLDDLARQAHGDFGMNSATHGAAPGGHEQGQVQVRRVLGGLAFPQGSDGLPAEAAPFYFQGFDQLYWDQPRDVKARLTVPTPLELSGVRRDFPILSERVNGRQLVWFDNAATTHKPQTVIDRLAYFYAHENSNIHRAAHELAARATDAYEAARNKVRDFLGAASSDEIIFVRGATEGINLIAQTFGKQNIGPGDEIIVSHLEHHANIVPWQQLAKEKGATIRVIPVDDTGQILLDEYAQLINERTRLVSVTHVSNALGTVTPVKQIIDIAHRSGVKVVIDGAQAVSHLRVNVVALDADFYVFSGHKVFGPTGIGAVYGKLALLNQLPPWQGGGNMIADVTFETTRYQPAPSRFEAGTGNIADAVGLGAALDYVQKLGLENIAAWEHALLDYATAGLQSIRGVRLIGTAHDKASVASFVLDGYQTEEVGKALNEEGIAVRSGHHCAQPILRRFGVESTVRPSFAFYNTCEEIDRMLDVLRRLSQARR